MKEIKKENGVSLKIEDMVVKEIYQNEFDGKKRASAHVAQKRVTTYPAQRMDTGFADGLYDSPEGQSYESERHTLVPVPEDATVESVAERVATFTDACIYRLLSNNLDEVISDKEKQAIESGLITKESLKPRYVVRDSEGNVYASVTTDGEVLEGDDRVVGKIVESEEGNSLEITNPNALLEFKRDIFSREYREDIDNRVKVAVTQAAEVEEHELAV